MVNFTGKLVVIGGQVHTWQELLFTAIDLRVYNADATLNAKMRQQMKDRFRAASAYIRRFLPATNIYIIDAYKGNVNGTINQAAWALPGDITGAAAGQAQQYDGGIEYEMDGRTGLASQALYAAVDTVMEVNIDLESVI